MNIQGSDFNKLNFDDFRIISMTLDFHLKILKIKIDGALLKKGTEWVELKEGTINVTEWSEIKISMYELKNKMWKNLDENNYDVLRDIREVELNNKLILRGFGMKTIQWLVYEISSPVIDMNFLE